MRVPRTFMAAAGALLLAFGLASARTAAQSAPAKPFTVTSSDGILRFTANPDEGTVTVRDLLNDDILSRSLVCPGPRGAVLTPNEVSLLVVCRGSRELVFLNTADFDVEARVAEVGAAPAGVRLSADGRFADVLDETGNELSTIDLESRRRASSATISAPLPTSPSGTDRRRAGGKKATRPGRSRPSPGPSPGARGQRRGGLKNQLAFIGTIHGDHRTSRLFSLNVLRRLISEISPEYVLTEIPPNRLERAAREFLADGRIAEPRVSLFPEYAEVVFPMIVSTGFHVLGTAAWNQPMDRYRREHLAAIERDPNRAGEWAEYRAAVKASESALARGGALDDPRWIHTDAYDAAQRLQLDVYDRLFNRDLGPGGWDNINRAHFAIISRALDEQSGEGVRFLLMFGAGHKSWMFPRLRARGDLEIIDVSKVLDRIAAEKAPSR